MAKGKINIIRCLIIFLIISLGGLSHIYNYPRLITYFFMPLIFVIAILLNKFSFPSFSNTYLKYFLGIVVLGLILSLVSQDLQVALLGVSQLLGVFIAIALTTELLNYKKYDFVKTFLWAFILCFIIMSLNLVSGFKSINVSTNYRAAYNFDLNENTYSYLSYFANMSIFYLIQITGKRVYIILSILCIALGIYVSFITASRSGLLFTLFVGVLYWAFVYDKLKAKGFYNIILISSFLLVGLFITYKVYTNSYLSVRIEHSLQNGDLRTKLFKEAVNDFLNHPITGLGPGQFKLTSTSNQFSHDSFTEIAANMGIIGIFFVLLLFVKPLWMAIKRYNKISDSNLKKLNILFFLSFILINGIYVFYQYAPAMIFFFLILGIQKREWLNYLFQKKEKRKIIAKGVLVQDI